MNILRRVLMLLLVGFFLYGATCSKKDSLKEALTAEPEKKVLITDFSVFKSGDYVVVSLEADSKLSYSAFKLEDPRRIVIDIEKSDLGKFDAPVKLDNSPIVDTVSPLKFETTSSSRIEVNLKKGVRFLVRDVNERRLDLILSPIGGADPAQYKTAIRSADLPFESLQDSSSKKKKKEFVEEEERILTKASDRNIETSISSVKFSQIGSVGRIAVETNNVNPQYKLLTRSGITRYTVDFYNAHISKDQERLINVTLDDSNVRSVTAFQYRITPTPIVKIVVNLDSMELYHLYNKEGVVYFDIGDEAGLALASELPEDEFVKRDEVITSQEEVFTGIPISLDFQKADIQNILRILADVSGINIITSSTVSGTVTMKLRNVPWDQALDVILRNNGLDMVRNGGIIRVATREEIQREKEATEKLLETDRKISPLVTQVVYVNFESAANIQANLATLKSERGSVDVNSRTNSLIIKDTRGRISEMIKLINKLDKEEPQVQIESRIVEVTTDDVYAIGVQWGGDYSLNTPVSFPHDVGIFGGVRKGGPNQTSGGTLVDTHSLLGFAPTGGVGFTLGHIAGSALLDARLLAMEKDGSGRIVSKPKIVTLNNQKAVIESGKEIPYSTVSAEGTRTQFKKATLRLEVIPHITPNKLVRMNIVADKNDVDPTGSTPSGPPIITKSATTEVVVPDGDTVVLGGLFKSTYGETTYSVPFLGKIPVLGVLFRGVNKNNLVEELLMFITPKILGRSLSEGDV